MFGAGGQNFVRRQLQVQVLFPQQLNTRQSIKSEVKAEDDGLTKQNITSAEKI